MRQLAAPGGFLPWSFAVQVGYDTPSLFVSAVASDGAQGRLRVVDNTGVSVTVAIFAIDDTGARFGPPTFTLNAWEAVAFEPSALVRSPDGLLSAVHGAGRTHRGGSAKSLVALPGNWARRR